MAKSLKGEFVKFYKEYLEPFGFKKVKGTQPYFVRVINDEILHVFSFINRPCMEQDYKNFWLVGGIATVYKKEFNFSVTPYKNDPWLVPQVTFRIKRDTDYPKENGEWDFGDYYYNEENMMEVVKKAARELNLS